MGFIDIVILVAVLGLIFCILFFNLYKNKNKDKCSGCPYRAKCKAEQCKIACENDNNAKK